MESEREDGLDRFDLDRFDKEWPAALGEIAGEMHAVDGDACFIWFQFFPLGLHELVRTTADRTVLESFYQFRGRYWLADVADISHEFLYGHCYWADVKRALRKLAARTAAERSLVQWIRAVAAEVEGPSALTLGISAVGLMTLRQAGAEFLEQAYSPPKEGRTPEEALRERASDAKGGVMWKRKPRIIMDERQADGWFPLTPGQHITTAAERDKRPHHQANGRCSPGNGSIPVDCRSGSCGTCWVGILGGNEKLAPVDPFERKRMEYFGYWESPFHRGDAERPLIRLACQTVAAGSCSIVIPSWNGVWGAARRTAFERKAT